MRAALRPKTLNVQNIFVDNAVIRSLIAANLDVDMLFAREATINALNAMNITSNTYLRLMVAGKADKDDMDALNERISAAELKLTEDSIVSTVRGSQQYKDDLAGISVSASGPEFIVGTQTVATANWTGVASFSELKDGQQITYWLPTTGGTNVRLGVRQVFPHYLNIAAGRNVCGAFSNAAKVHDFKKTKLQEFHAAQHSGPWPILGGMYAPFSKRRASAYARKR